MPPRPDLLLLDGRIYTGDPASGFAEAMAVWRGLVFAVGSSKEIAGLGGAETRVLNLRGALVVPGLSDNHTHFLEGLVGLRNEVDLRGVPGKRELRERVRAAAAGLEPGEWLVGGCWYEESWGGELPDKLWIDDLTPDNPAFIYRRDLHSAFLNTAALEAAGFLGGPVRWSDGELVVGGDGAPTGLLREGVLAFAKKFVPPPPPERVRAAVRRAVREANALGLTHICDMISGPEEFGFYLDLERSGELSCRFDLLPPLPLWERFARAGLRSGVGLDLVRLGPMKGFIDGSLGSRAALMLEPYTDDPANRGRFEPMAEPLSSMRAKVLCAARAGFAVALHAIGDRANRIALDIFEDVRADDAYPHLRHRIEHAQHLHPDDLARFAELDITASCQAVHLADDACYADEALGPERARRSYPFRSLLESGAVLTFGSDWPVAPLNPLEGIWAAATRRSRDGRFPGGWVPRERISVRQALEAYTVNAALTTGRADQWGRLAPGLAADFVQLDRDIFRCDPEELRGTGVLRTFLRGRQVYPEEEG